MQFSFFFFYMEIIRYVIFFSLFNSQVHLGKFNYIFLKEKLLR